ncbi:MAG: transposase [Chloroflexota bacterium]
MPAKLVNAGGEACVQFPCDRCGNNLVAGLDDPGKLFKCRQCDNGVYMPPVPCHHPSCSGTYRRCRGVIAILPESAEELRRARAEADREIAALDGAAPTDAYHEDVADIRASIEASVTRYRCGGCGATHSWAAGRPLGYESGTATCDRVVCTLCRRMPAVDALPEPDSIFNRALDAAYAYVWLDTADTRIRREVYVGDRFDRYETAMGQVVIAIGARQSGEREILACALPETCDQAFWVDYLRGLVDRGVTGIGLVIADEHEGLKAALADVLPGTPLQRSRTRFMHQVLAAVPAPDRAWVRTRLKGIFACSDHGAARAQLVETAQALTPRAAELLRSGADAVFAYMSFPRGHWTRICSLDGFKPLNDRIHDGLHASDRVALSHAKADCLFMNERWKAEGVYLRPVRVHAARG